MATKAKVAKLHKKRVEQAGFAVLKSPDIPSILVETGFISNPSESRLLASNAYQKKMARAIHAGIREWFLAHPPSGTLIAWQKQQLGQQYIIARLCFRCKLQADFACYSVYVHDSLIILYILD